MQTDPATAYDHGSDPNFVAYYAKESQSPETIGRFTRVRDRALALLSDAGRTTDLTRYLRRRGFITVERFDMLARQPLPPGRRQLVAAVRRVPSLNLARRFAVWAVLRAA